MNSFMNPEGRVLLLKKTNYCLIVQEKKLSVRKLEIDIA
jgi:hypothetical protein